MASVRKETSKTARVSGLAPFGGGARSSGARGGGFRVATYRSTKPGAAHRMSDRPPRGQTESRKETTKMAPPVTPATRSDLRQRHRCCQPPPRGLPMSILTRCTGAVANPRPQPSGRARSLPGGSLSYASTCLSR